MTETLTYDLLIWAGAVMIGMYVGAAMQRVRSGLIPPGVVEGVLARNRYLMEDKVRLGRIIARQAKRISKLKKAASIQHIHRRPRIYVGNTPPAAE